MEWVTTIYLIVIGIGMIVIYTIDKEPLGVIKYTITDKNFNEYSQSYLPNKSFQYGTQSNEQLICSCIFLLISLCRHIEKPIIIDFFLSVTNNWGLSRQTNSIVKPDR